MTLQDHQLSQAFQSTVPSKFSIEVELPSGKKTRLIEIKNRDYCILNKFCNNGDFEGFESVISKLIPGYYDMNVLDKAAALITFRALYIDPDLTVLNDESIPVTLPINMLLENIEKLPKLRPIHGECSDFEYVVGLPTCFDSASSDIYTIIKSITYSDKILENEYVQEVFDFLPCEVFSDINKSVLIQHGKVSAITLIEDLPDYKLKNLTINLTNGTFPLFVMSLYKLSMDNMFESMYIFTQHFGSIDYLDMSPLDSRVLENILRRELAKSQEANKTPQHDNPLTPHL